MKYFFSYLFLVLTSFSALCQSCPDNFAGTKTLYEPQQNAYTPVPQGYEPIIINYVGRHGARHLTKDVNTSSAYHLIMKADSINMLTKQGKSLQAMVLLLEKVEKKEYKSISEEGKIELHGIAERMYKNNPALFKTTSLKVTITKELRTKQSAEAFLKKLTIFNIPVDVPLQVNDTMLRFYDLSPAYISYEKEGSWVKQIQDLKRNVNYDILTNKFTSRFFTASFSKTLNASESEEFAKDVFGFNTILNSIQKEIKAADITKDKLNFQSFFSCDELKIFNQIDEAEDFLLKGPASDNNGIQIRIAAPLLMDFITTTVDFIKTKAVNLSLRFTHAEAIAPFAALMGITTASRNATTANKISGAWSAAQIIPLSANIQWIIYSKKNSADYLVRFLLNEKEVAINGLSSKTFPFYQWKDVEKLYNDKLMALGIKQGDDMYRFLLKVK